MSEVSNLLKNKKHIIPFKENATQGEIVSSLKFFHDSISTEKTEEGRYQTADKQHVIKKRVTDKAKHSFEKGKTKEELAKFAEKNKKYSEFGTYMHGALERIMQLKHADTWKKDRASVVKEITSKWGITESMVGTMEKGVNELLNYFQDVQNSIDPEGKYEILQETIVGDPYSDEAGTIDVLVVFSDGSGGIVDFKTKKDKGYDSLFGYEDLSNYKLQLSSYKRILVERFNLQKIRFGRVVPIGYQFQRKSTGGFNWEETDNVASMQMGSEYGKKLEQRMVLPEITDVNSIDNFIHNLYERLRSKPNRELEELLNSLVISQDLNSTVSYFTHVAKEFVDNYNNNDKKISTDQYALLEELRIGATFLTELSGELTKLDRFPEIRKQVSEAAAKVNDLRSVYSDLMAIRQEKILDSVYKAAGKQVPKDAKKRVIEEDSMFTKWLGRISDFSNPFFKYLRKVLDDIQLETRLGVREDEKVIQKITTDVQKWLKESGKSWGDFVDLIFNRDTENLYSEYSKDFYEKRQEAIDNGNYKWLVERYKPREGYQEKFQKDLLDKTKEYESKYDDKATRLRWLDRWRESRDLSLDANGKPVFPKAWTNFRNIELKEEFKEEARSEEFKRIREVPEALAYYNTFIDLNRKYRNMLGLKWGKIPDNFVPHIRKDLIEKLREQGISASWKELKESLNIREDDEAYGHINDLTGRFEKTVPMYFVNPFRNDDGSLKRGEKSTDFSKSLLLFSKMAHNYVEASRYEANILAVGETLEAAKYVKVYPDGRWIYNSNGDPDSVVKTDWKNVFDKFVDAYFYGKTIDAGKTVRVFGTEINTTQVLRKAKNLFGLKSLGLAFLPATASYISAGMQAWMEGREGIIYTREQWQSATKRMTKDFNKYHMLFKFFEVSNDDFLSTLQVSKKGSIVGDNLYQDKLRQFVSSRTLMAPYRLGDEHLDIHITNAMAENYLVNPEGVVRRKGMVEGEEWKPILEVINFTEDGEATIMHLKDAVAIKNMMKAFKRAVRTGQRGIKGTMSDEDISLAQTSLFGNLALQFRSWMPGILNKRFGSLKFNDDLDTLKWGKYQAAFSEVNIADATALSHYFTKGVVPTLLQFAKDLTLNTVTLGMIESTKYNVEGRYNSNEAYKATIDAWFNRWKQQHPDEFNRLVELYGSEEKLLENFLHIKQQAIRNTVNELRAVLMLFSLIMFLKSDGDDDGEALWRENWLAHKAMQVANRTKLELQFAFDPTSLVGILKSSTIPLIGLLVDTANVIKEVFEPVSDAITGREEKKNEKELGDRLARLFGPIGNVIRTFDLTEIDEKSAQ